MSKITLDAETFKALASEARLRVLRALDERRKTLAELSRGLELNKATVHEHLQLLSAAGLVRKRDDEGRKWIYYELTWTGSKILHPETTTSFSVLLGLSALAAGGGILALGRAAGWWLVQKASSNDGFTGGGPEAASAPAEDSLAMKAEETGTAAADDGGSFFDDGGWLVLALAGCLLMFLVLSLMMRRKLAPNPLDVEAAQAAEEGTVNDPAPTAS